jgi:hypothetical protein
LGITATEIVKIKPVLEHSAVQAMEKTLNQRFKNVAGKFGRGLSGAFRTGFKFLIGGAALGYLMKILNPIRETNDAINETLNNADSIDTQSKQFGTTSGKLARTMAVTGAVGLTQDETIQAILRMQEKIGLARTGEDKTLEKFVDIKDSVVAFKEVIKSLREMTDKEKMLVMAGDIFGGRAAISGKFSELFQTDIEAMEKRMRLPGEGEITSSMTRLASIEEFKRVGEGKQALTDLLNKSREITKETIRKQLEAKRLDDERTTSQIKGYKAMADMDNNIKEIMNVVREKGLPWMETVSENFVKTLGLVEAISNNLYKIPFIGKYFDRPKKKRED